MKNVHHRNKNVENAFYEKQTRQHFTSTMEVQIKTRSCEHMRCWLALFNTRNHNTMLCYSTFSHLYNANRVYMFHKIA